MKIETKTEIMDEIMKYTKEKDYKSLNKLLEHVSEEYCQQETCESVVNKWAKTLNELVNWANNKEV